MHKIELLTEIQVAEIIGVTPKTLRKWRAKKSGPAHFLITNKTIRYNKTAVHQWLVQKTNCALNEKIEIK